MEIIINEKRIFKGLTAFQRHTLIRIATTEHPRYLALSRKRRTEHKAALYPMTKRHELIGDALILPRGVVVPEWISEHATIHDETVSQPFEIRLSIAASPAIQQAVTSALRSNDGLIVVDHNNRVMTALWLAYRLQQRCLILTHSAAQAKQVLASMAGLHNQQASLLTAKTKALPAVPVFVASLNTFSNCPQHFAAFGVVLVFDPYEGNTKATYALLNQLPARWRYGLVERVEVGFSKSYLIDAALGVVVGIVQGGLSSNAAVSAVGFN